MASIPTAVDDITVRLVAAIILVLTTVALLTSAWWLYAVLAADFTIRAALGPRHSPIARLAGAIRPRLTTPARPTPFAPKRFAATMGAVMTAIAAVLLLLEGSLGAVVGVPALVIGVAMIAFPLLEAALGFCVGCRIFAGLMRLGVIPDDVCLECADISGRTRAALAAR
ncbi:DUF4395 domain-containing protein [Janibacter sp. G56]|uniref:DUF4395 domain-containing protein n=1 Tax=Janibacter sp. G56 TaxID=3418717 RepID=UPI003CFC159B